MKNYLLTLLLALLVVLTGLTLRRGIAEIGGSPVPKIPPTMAIGGSPVPKIPKVAIGGSPVPKIPPKVTQQVEVR